MRTLYLDLFSGISGDMFIGALVDLGVEEQPLERELSKLGLKEYHLHFSRGQRGSIAGVKFDVHLASDHEHEHHMHGHEHGHAQAPEHAHSQTHSHDHPHSDSSSYSVAHSHTQEHSRTFAEIKQLISHCPLSD